MAEFDRNRFEALVLYIAHRRRDDGRFGRTKMAKVLFYSDFSIYQDQGESLTGATYIRMPFGPFPEALEDTEEALEAKGLAVLAHDGEGEYDEKRIIPTKGAPDLRSLFEEWQILAVNDWIDRVAAATATQISEMSHHHPGWLLAKKNGETIPYETAILPQSRPTARRSLSTPQSAGVRNKIPAGARSRFVCGDVSGPRSARSRPSLAPVHPATGLGRGRAADDRAS